MDYKEMAKELLDTRVGLLHVPANRELSKLVKGELFVLNYLLSRGDKTYPKDISKAMLVSTARIAVLLNAMEKKGFVTREADGDDNRQIIVRLTPKGYEEARNKREDIINAVIHMLEFLDPDEAAEYLRIQKKIVKGLGRSV